MTIAVDLDKTLAFHHSGMCMRCIGKPIPKMLKRVRNWLERGDKVVIFTARAGYKPAIPAIRKWLKQNNLPNLEITNIKKPEFDVIFDDKAEGVIPNKGVTWEEQARDAMK